jgi:predicted secreted protein
VITLSAALAGCSALTVDNPFKPAPTFVRLDEAPAAPLTLARGQSIVVTLPANIPTGYRWEASAGFAPTLQLTGTPDYTMPPGVGGAVASAGPVQPVATVPIGQIAWTPTPVPVGATAETMVAAIKPVPVADGGQMTFIFLAASAGTTSLELAYRRPFEPGVAPAKTVRYDVTVR